MPYAKNENPDEHIRIDPKIFAGGSVMSFIAGYVNASLLDIYNVPVSHMSGAVSRLGIDLSEHKYSDLKTIALIVFFFLAGSILSGFIIGSKELKPGKRYGFILILEAGFLLLSSYLVNERNILSVPFASLACGMQNAMASSYYGLIIRTTHVTGILTDIGVLLGHWIRHRHIKLWKLAFLVCIVSGFLLGAVFSVSLKNYLQCNVLWVAPILCLLAAMTYFLMLKELRAGVPAT